MNTQKIDYAKKLIKFDKLVEATNILEKILVESDDEALLRSVIELLLVEVEFKQVEINKVKINYLITKFKALGGEYNKIKKFENLMKENSELIKDKILGFSEEFNEIYCFFEHNFLTSKSTEEVFNKNTFKIVDFNLAKVIAHDQDVDEPYESWNDLRSSISKEIYSIIFRERINIKLFEEKINYLNEVIEKKIDDNNKVFYYFLDDIESDIHLILMATYVKYSEKLINLLLDAYKSNFFPCGWQGEYPTGQLCITNGMY
ncbi:MULTISPECIES: hypothetical protein [Acinetobacter]|uniref:hypothetical protein n=1 Tax=Acinetobacter TaxID=469 RepID=UPI001D0F271B|nr:MULTISPECIES: hypothetical protein [Acinetobacter]